MGRKRHRPDRTVTKASGEIEPYAPDKLRRSLERAGANQHVVRLVMKTIDDGFVPGISTRDLFRLAHLELRRVERTAAARYSLRRATLALGPSGYPFERLIAALFAAQGYSTDVGRILAGRCVHHEVDVVAARDDHRVLVECKFHSQVGYRTDVKVALYVRARALDLKENPENAVGAFWLVTNAKFTTDAVRYGQCSGLELLGWDYPENAGLQERLERANILPITCATTLRATTKRRLLESGVVTTGEVLRHPDVLGLAGLRDTEIARVITELRALEGASVARPRAAADPPVA